MQHWEISDPGKVRTQNQDCYRIEELEDGSLLAVVCDGMGGAKAGDVAARLAAEVFSNEVARNVDKRLTEDELAAVLDGAVTLANSAVYEQSCSCKDFNGMGTTLVAALIRDDIAYVVNVGDSRAYFIDEAYIGAITMDHSVVEMMVRRGEITREEAKLHPGKNLITRAVGTAESVLCDLFRQTLKHGDSVLLCSDGLSNMMADQEILFEVAHGGARGQACERLLSLAVSRGAPDNVTVVLVTV